MFSLLVRKLFNKSKTVSGFTLIELLAVIVIAGILAAISAQSFEALQNTRRINAAQGELFNAIKQAQSRAKKDKISYQVSIRRNPAGDGEIQVGVHNAKFPSGPNAGKDRDDVDNWSWRPIVSDIRDSQRVLVGAVNSQVKKISEQRVICVKFDSKGNYDLTGHCINFTDTYVVIKGERSSGTNQKLRCVRVASSLIGGITSFKQGEASCNDTSKDYL